MINIQLFIKLDLKDHATIIIGEVEWGVLGMKIEFLNYELNPNLSSIPQDVSHQTRQGLHELN